jgi:hypothetical protein
MNNDLMRVHSDCDIGSLSYGSSTLLFPHPLSFYMGDEFYVDYIAPHFFHKEEDEDGNEIELVDQLEVCLLIKRNGSKKFRKKFIYAKPVTESS